MTVWSSILGEIRDDNTLWVVGGALLSIILLRAIHAEQNRRIRAIVVLTFLHLVLVPVVGVLNARGSELYRDLRLPALIFAVMAVVGMSGAVLFAVLLPLVRVHTPRILQDVLVAGSSLVALFIVASRMNFNLSSLVATSAVLTAVIGFALQDTLGNIVGGLALQLDNSITEGDWIKFGDITGKVTDIRWRFTAVETRNWETVIIPNSMMMKGQVTVLGRREGKPLQLRRWVWFTVDYRHAPSEVIRVVSEALKATPLPHMASDPAPNCLLMEFNDSFGKYAVRYWLTDLAVDDPTDSAVRTSVYFALKRAGIPLSIPAHAVFITEESGDRKVEKSREDFDQRLAAISRVELFSRLSEEDRAKLAKSLRHTPFAQGETMTRQGAEAHWLYMIIHGEACVRVTNQSGLVKDVAQLKAGDFFGEMSLMTGEPRGATVTATTDAECYRLDKAAFQEIITARPELAEHVAAVLAQRRMHLLAVKEDLDLEAQARRLAAAKMDLLGKVREFFALGPDKRVAS